MSDARDVQRKAHKTALLVLGVDDEADRTLLRVLGALGCTLPADMHAPGAEPHGGFEPHAVRALNGRLFEKAGSNWDDVSPFHPDWRQSPGAKSLVKHAVSALEEQFENAPLIALGGRDLSRLLPLWAEALRLFGCNIRPIIMLRNPLEAAEILQRGEECSQSLAEVIWVRRALDAEYFTRGSPRYFTSFERLIQSWDIVLHDAQEALQLVWPKPLANVELDVRDILDGLEFSKELQARSLTNTLLPGWVRESYMILNGWAMSEEMAAHRQLLDSLKMNFDVAAGAFGRVVRAERRMQSAVTLLSAEVQEVKERGDSIAAERDALVAEREALVAQVGRLNAAEAELALAKSALQEARRAATLLNAELEELKERRDSIAAERDALVAEREALVAQVGRLNAAEAELALAKSALQEARRAATLLNAELEELKERRDDLEVELKEARSEVAATRARRKEMARVIANRDAQLKTRYEELAQLQKQMVRTDPVRLMKRSLGQLKRRLRDAGPSST
jgi:hypothetical protein